MQKSKDMERIKIKNKLMMEEQQRFPKKERQRKRDD